MRLTGRGLSCQRGSREVFTGLDFSVASSEVLVVQGPNGAGKSSLLRLIAGLIPRAAGEIRLEGGDAELTIGEQAHYLGHQDALKPSLSVLENLTFWAHYLGAGLSTVPAALDRVGLTRLADLPAGFLSAGQRRRLSIARLLAVSRSIWLLDEPTSSLDRGAQARLAELLTEHRAAGGLIVAATHLPLGLPETRELRIGGEP